MHLIKLALIPLKFPKSLTPAPTVLLPQYFFSPDSILPRLQAKLSCIVMSSTIPDMEDLPSYSFHGLNFHSFSDEEIAQIRVLLLDWYDTERKKLPWRGDSPPYTNSESSFPKPKRRRMANMENTNDDFAFEIKSKKKSKEAYCSSIPVSAYGTWVSEVMSQQTRIETVIDYFLRWMEKFPTIETLAAAEEQTVNMLWAGLGYYRRGRMLREGARYVMSNHNGQLPSSISELKKIPGVGPYTAGAISSIAFGCQEPVVDGNVIRVISRLRACAASPKNNDFVALCWKLAGALVPECRPGDFNQALMEFGSLVCSPKSPSCSTCPLRLYCKTSALCSIKSEKESIQNSTGEQICECPVCQLDDEGLAYRPIKVEDFPLKAVRSIPTEKVLAACAIFRLKCTSQFEEIENVKHYIPQRMETLMVKRSTNGLLAGQWECPNSVILTSKDRNFKIDELQIHRTDATAKLIDHLKILGSITRRDYVGEVLHIFSHERHTMMLESIECVSDNLEDCRSWVTSDGREAKWMDQQNLNAVGITTGMKKVLKLASSKLIQIVA